jgi:hypothetical protein
MEMIQTDLSHKQKFIHHLVFTLLYTCLSSIHQTPSYTPESFLYTRLSPIQQTVTCTPDSLLYTLFYTPVSHYIPYSLSYTPDSFLYTRLSAIHQTQDYLRYARFSPGHKIVSSTPESRLYTKTRASTQDFLLYKKTAKDSLLYTRLSFTTESVVFTRLFPTNAPNSILFYLPVSLLRKTL